MSQKNRNQKQIKTLREENNQLKKSLDRANKWMYLNGMHLNDQPFIPEYLNFELTIVEDKNEAVRGRVYTKDGFNIARYIDTDKDEYVVLSPTGKRSEVFINSMYEAFIVLNSCGMALDVKEYVLHGNLQIEK